MLDSLISDEQMFKIVTPQKLNSFHCAIYLLLCIIIHKAIKSRMNKSRAPTIANTSTTTLNFSLSLWVCSFIETTVFGSTALLEVTVAVVDRRVVVALAKIVVVGG